MLKGKKLLAICMVFMLIASMMVCTQTSFAEGENIIADGNFETGKGSWSIDPAEDATAPEGNMSLSVPSFVSRDSIEISETGIYKLSFYVKYTKAASNLDARGVNIYWTAYTSGTTAPSETMVPCNKVGEWRLHESYVKLESAPEDKTAWYKLNIQNYNGSEFCIDDVKLEKVSEQDYCVIAPDFNKTTTVNETEVPYVGFNTQAESVLGVNYKTSEQTHDGEGKALEICGDDAGDDTCLLFYAPAFPTGNSYAVSFWAKLDTENDAASFAYARVGLNQWNADTLVNQQANLNDGKWHKYVFTTSTKPWGNQLYALAIGFSGKGSVIIDDVRFEDSAKLTDINGDFETITNDGKFFGQGSIWKNNNTIEYSSLDAHSGSRSIYISNPSGGKNFMYMYVDNMKNGQFYKLSWWQKNVTGTSAQANLVPPADGELKNLSEEVAYTNGTDWQKHEVYFYYPEKASAKMDIQFRSWETEYYIDDIELAEITDTEKGFAAAEFTKDGKKLSSIEAGTITVDKPVYGKSKTDAAEYRNIVALYKVENGVKTLESVNIIDKKISYKLSNTWASGGASDEEKFGIVTTGTYASVEVPEIIGEEKYVIESFLWEGNTSKPLTAKETLK